jgi:hypothetical protein
VAILQLIALFITVSGKPLDGFLMLAVATMLIFDAARSLRQAAPGGSGTSPGAVAAATSPSTSHQHGLRRLLVGGASKYQAARSAAIARPGAGECHADQNGPDRRRRRLGVGRLAFLRPR